MGRKKKVVEEVKPVVPLNKKDVKLNKWYLFLTQLLNFFQSKTIVVYSLLFIMLVCFGVGYWMKYPAIRSILTLEHQIKIEDELQQRLVVESTVKEIMGWHKCDSLEVYEAIMSTFHPILMSCLISQESGFTPKAVSHANARGIAQVMGYHFKKGEDPFNVTTNIRVGAALLKEYWDYFEGDPNQTALALASYNAGFPLVKRLGKIPNIAETQDYVIKIDKKLNKVSNIL